jgi:tetratricopeptide (TPR) repeat protein
MNTPPRRLELFAEAEAVCHDVLGDSPDHPTVLHFAGMLASRSGQDDVALVLLTEAAALAPRTLQYQVDLGNALLRRQRLSDALGAYLQAITIDPMKVALYAAVSEALLRKGLLVEGLAVAEEAVRLEPSNARAHDQQGNALRALGRWPAALAAYARVLQLAPRDSTGYLAIGQVYLQLLDWTAAADIFARGLGCGRASPDLHVGLGVALLRLGSLAAATDAFTAALSIDPKHVPAARQLVLAQAMTGRADDAVGAWCSLGAALAFANQLEEAAVAYREALSRKPDCLRALVRLGHLQGGLAKPHESVPCYERALAIKPDHARVHRGLSWSRLATGDFVRGWTEAGLDKSELDKRQRDFEQPTWDGSDAPHETILIWAGTGLGDTIQFLRYLPLIRARCQRLIVECDKALASLFSHHPCIARVITTGAPLPAFDKQISFHGLGAIFDCVGVTLSSAVPYLATAVEAREVSRRRIDHGLSRRKQNVGLVWASEPERKDASMRFVTLSALAPLATIANVHLVSLQLGASRADLLALPDGFHVHEVLSEPYLMRNTAAIVPNLDLVITIDTMMAHLAGALGRPVWVLLPYAAEWRWLANGDTSRWYPTMRLFRQRRRGDWRDPIARISAALQEPFGPGILAD